jgi:hypothetical protein
LNAFNQIQNRTLSIPDENFSRFATIKLNLFQVIGYSQASKIILLIFAILLVFIFIKNIKNINLKKSWYWIAIALIPYFWYLVAANHSYLHVWFTYRNQFGAITAGLLFVTSVLKNSPKGKNKIA